MLELKPIAGNVRPGRILRNRAKWYNGETRPAAGSGKGEALLKISIVAAVLVLFSASIYYGSFEIIWESIVFKDRIVFLVTRASIAYSIVTLLYFLFRMVLWMRYKPCEASEGKLPFISVVIPAYNEGRLVNKAIRLTVTSGYPLHLLEVICVDDGSKDDTYFWMQKVKKKYPETVRLIKLPHNMGKRQALYHAFEQAKGEILVTIDSDSLIEKGSLHNIVAPMMKNRQVGAVAGNVKVLNRCEGMIPKMLSVSFVLSFDFVRACQSTYGAVLCCPGAFSAYRSDVVKKVMPEWLHQTFLGQNCTYGEDRALTNLILRSGFYTVYQNNAVVHTQVPATYGKLTKMYLRWQRSNIRESVVLSSFILKKYRRNNRILPFVDFIVGNMRYPFQYYAILFFAINLFLYPVNVLRYLSIVGLIAAMYSMLYLRKEKDSNFVYGILYGYFSTFALQWIFPYAAFTLRNKSWMTR